MAAAWKSLSLTVPGKDLLDPVSSVIETLVLFLDVLSAILDTVKVFLTDIGNPIKALVAALVAEITQLLETLRKSGIYAYADVPNPLTDPSFKSSAGGFRAFGKRFKGSLVDQGDPNRPQPVSGFTTGGFIVFCADADEPVQLMNFLRVLLSLFGKDTIQPRYPAPAGFKALPVGSKEDPILSISGMFSNPPKSISLSWSLPSSERLFDSSFSGIASAVVSEFVPPKWLVEKSTKNPATQEVRDDQLSDPSATGIVVSYAATTYQDPRGGNTPISRKVRVKDEYGDDHIKWQEHYVVDQSSPTFYLGQLGKFRWVDTDVVPDKTYYYRIRAFSGALDVQGTDLVLQKKTNFNDSGRPYLVWPSQSSSDPVIMGKSSGTVSARLPDIPAGFDVIAVLNGLYLSAFSLDFHVPADPSDRFNQNGMPADDSTPNSHVGRGQMTDQAGSLSFRASTTISRVEKTYSTSTTATGRALEMPWQQADVRHQASRLTVTTTSAMLTGGSQFVNGFKSLCQGPLPKGAFQTTWSTPTSTIEDLVLAMTADPTDDSVKSYVSAYTDPELRANIAAAIEYVKVFSLGGDTPDWSSVSLLRDVIPWNGSLLYDMLAQVTALGDAFKGASEELVTFVDLIQRKIDVLERFLAYLIEILNFVESLELNVSVLSVPVIPGGVKDWMAAFDSALNPPTSGPNGYTGGIAFAYLGPDAAAIAAAFAQIF